MRIKNSFLVRKRRPQKKLNNPTLKRILVFFFTVDYYDCCNGVHINVETSVPNFIRTKSPNGMFVCLFVNTIKFVKTQKIIILGSFCQFSLKSYLTNY